MDVAARRADDGSHQAVIPPFCHGGWLRLAVRLPRRSRSAIVRLRVQDAAGCTLTGDNYLDRMVIPAQRHKRAGLVYLPPAACALRIDLMDGRESPDALSLRLHRCSRGTAALLAALRHPLMLFAYALAYRNGVLAGLRAAVSVVATGTPPRSYRRWVAWFDAWPEARLAPLRQAIAGNPPPRIAVFVCCGTGGATDGDPDGIPGPALQATIDSIRSQHHPIDYQLIGDGKHRTLDAALARNDAAYIALLQAGEILPRHASLLLASALMAWRHPAAVLADEDSIAEDGTRRDPLFKPVPGHSLMLSGTQTRGVWAVRAALLQDATADPRWAEALRLAVWLRLYETGAAAGTRRLPCILTHRRADCPAAPPALLAGIVAAHLARMGIAADIGTTWPLRVQPRPRAGQAPPVSIVVPSACRSDHTLRCLGAVLAGTDYPEFELLVVLSQAGPPDAAQQRIIRQLQSHRHVRIVLHANDGPFNYAVANNHGAAAARYPILCLLNDDVLPLAPGWLGRMVGHLADPSVGIVGARLYYASGRVQHAGIVMGLGGIGEHADRGLPRASPGPGLRCSLDHEVAAVTGACLVIPRALYQSIGGMDTTFRSAFNDADLCLKAGALGRSVVLAAGAELTHAESTSFRRHYAGADATRQSDDATVMLDRWAAVVADDPFHSPNLSLQRGHEALPAFPPRPGDPFSSDTTR
jgi:GT2 family glycosyltransferase